MKSGLRNRRLVESELFAHPVEGSGKLHAPSGRSTAHFTGDSRPVASRGPMVGNPQLFLRKSPADLVEQFLVGAPINWTGALPGRLNRFQLSRIGPSYVAALRRLPTDLMPQLVPGHLHQK